MMQKSKLCARSASDCALQARFVDVSSLYCGYYYYYYYACR